MFKSIRWRITLPFAILSLFSLLGLSLYLSNILRQNYIENLDATLTTEARLLGEALIPLLEGGVPEVGLDEPARHWADVISARVTIVSADGTVLGESHEDRSLMDNHSSRPEIAAAFSSGKGSSTRYSNTIGQQMMYTAVPILQNEQVLGVVRVAVPLEGVEASVGQVQRILMTATILVITLTIVLAALISYRTTRPVRELTQAVQQMATGQGSGAPVVTGRDEIGQLAQAFNVMSVRLREQISALQAEGAKLSAVLQKMTDGVLIVDQEGRVELINQSAEMMFDVKQQAVLGRSLVEVTKHYQVVEMWERCQTSGEGQTVSLDLGHKKRFVEGNAAPLGPLLPGRTLLLFQDVTRQRRTEIVRRDFISNVSHELRTPLAALKALTETLQDGALKDPPAAQRFLSLMEIEVDSLSLMVSELVELSRIESNRVPLNLRPTRPLELVNSAYERLVLQAERAHLNLTRSCPEDLPLIKADTVRIQQVLVNLIHNAIKFTPEGGQITVRAEEGNGEVLFSVRDTGIGIAASDLPRIFERFYKVDRSRATSGTGLGLAIVRHLVEAHSGKIWAESQPEQGSSFYFTIPVAETPEKFPTSKSPA